MSFPEILDDHFDGGHHMTDANNHDDGPTLAQLFGKIKAGREAFAAAGDLP